MSETLLCVFLPGNVLLSQDPAVQVPLALEGLTAVFGMGTRGAPPPSLPDILQGYSLKTECESNLTCTNIRLRCTLLTCTVFSGHPNLGGVLVWLSPRPISIRQLHTLPHFHPGPINLVVYKGSYLLGNLILRGASRLDAFSAYPVRT